MDRVYAMTEKGLTDRERMFLARQFFWSQMDRLDQVVSVEVAQRQIAKIASALPPFTKIEGKN